MFVVFRSIRPRWKKWGLLEYTSAVLIHARSFPDVLQLSSCWLRKMPPKDEIAKLTTSDPTSLYLQQGQLAATAHARFDKRYFQVYFTGFSSLDAIREPAVQSVLTAMVIRSEKTAKAECWQGNGRPSYWRTGALLSLQQGWNVIFT